MMIFRLHKNFVLDLVLTRSTIQDQDQLCRDQNQATKDLLLSLIFHSQWD